VLTPAEADGLIGQHLQCLPIESLPLAQCAGAVLRENIYAERDQPPFDRVAMDGIALCSRVFGSGSRSFRVQATQAAGDAPLTLGAPTDCIEVMTGAVLPSGCDAVVAVEELSVAGGQASLAAHVRVEPWQNVHRRGSDTRQGTLLLSAGQRLRAPEIAIAASAGMARIRVASQPMLVVISTGNELVEPGEPVLAHQVRRSNAYAIVAALRRRGFTNVSNDHILDDQRMTHDRLKQHLEERDVLILSGGVSQGKFDLVPQALKGLGVEEVFYQVAQRPGMPMWFGIGPAGQAVFGLPGNPVATLVCLIRYVAPAMLAAMGARRTPAEPIALAKPVTFHRNVTYFLPVKAQFDGLGRAVALPRPPNGPGDFLALTQADGFVELPPRVEGFPEGFVASLYRW